MKLTPDIEQQRSYAAYVTAAEARQERIHQAREAREAGYGADVGGGRRPGIRQAPVGAEGLPAAASVDPAHVSVDPLLPRQRPDIDVDALRLNDREMESQRICEEAERAELAIAEEWGP